MLGGTHMWPPRSLARRAGHCGGWSCVCEAPGRRSCSWKAAILLLRVNGQKRKRSEI